MLRKAQLGKRVLALAATVVLVAQFCVIDIGAQWFELAGTWVGGYTLGNKWTAVAAHFDAPGQGGFLLDMARDRVVTVLDLDAEASRVRFKAAGLDEESAFDGTREDDVIVGELRQGGLSGFFYLARVATITAEAYDACIGRFRIGGARTLLFTRADGADQLFYLDAGQQVRLFPIQHGQLLSQRGELFVPHYDAAGSVIGFALQQLYAPQVSAILYAAKEQPFRAEEVHFESSGASLVGTLLSPFSQGPHPALVVLHGAGASERYYYRVFADELVLQGTSVLLYDQRGSGSSTGSPQGSTVDEYAADALAAVRYLAARSDVDLSRIGVLGISQGARVAPMVAALTEQVGSVVVLSAPGMPLSSLELHNVDRRYREAGFPAAVAEMGLRYRKLVQDWERVNRQPERLQADVDPVVFWQQLHQPALLIYGGSDEVLPPDDSADLIMKALEGAGNTAVSIVIFPEANHSLLVRGQDGVYSLASGLMEVIGSWIQQQPVPPPEGSTSAGRSWVRPSGHSELAGRYRGQPWYGRALTQLSVSLVSACVFLWAGVRWRSALRWSRWRDARQQRTHEQTQVQAVASLTGWVGAILLCGFWVFAWRLSAPDAVSTAGSRQIVVALWVFSVLSIVSALLTAGLALLAGRFWLRKAGTLGERIRLAILTVTAVAFLCFLSYWRLLPGAL